MIYGRIWSMRPWQCVAVMIRKRVLNMDVLGYSGEVYLFYVGEGPRAACAQGRNGHHQG